MSRELPMPLRWLLFVVLPLLALVMALGCAGPVEPEAAGNMVSLAQEETVTTRTKVDRYRFLTEGVPDMDRYRFAAITWPAPDGHVIDLRYEKGVVYLRSVPPVSVELVTED